MKTMADVLDEHVQSVRNQRCSCGWRGDVSKSIIDPQNIHWQHRRHVAEALSAAGFGLVADEKRRLELAALLAYEAVEESALREARARALLDAAEALDLQPPKVKAQYVSTLRLYALEPWRLETPAASERGGE